jgi:WhiB family redox-sensing transcriptional regulator
MATAPEFDGTQSCKTLDTDVFFPENGPGVKLKIESAKQICRDCRFVYECLEYALQVDVDGIWGATTKPERRRLRKTMQIQAPKSLNSEIDAFVNYKITRKVSK